MRSSLTDRIGAAAKELAAGKEAIQTNRNCSGVPPTTYFGVYADCCTLADETSLFERLRQ
jgi:hypothetical protein